MNQLLCKPLLMKELRETLRWSPIGMIVIGWLCWGTIPSYVVRPSSLAASFVFSVGIGAALAAVALGLLQSLGDMRTDARGFLLHRPVGLRSIFLTKLAAGFLAYAACLTPPLILTAWRLAVLGPERFPVSPLDLGPLAIAALVIFLLHPAAMWTVFRTARWVGTRTLPLAFAGTGIMWAIGLLLESRGWWLAGLFPLVVIAWSAVTIHAAWHAFAHQTFLPPAASREAMSVSRAVGLFIGCAALLTTIAVTSTAMLLPRSYQDFVVYDLAVDRDGQLWELKREYDKAHPVIGQEADILGRRVTLGESSTDRFARLPEDWQPASAARFIHTSPPPPRFQFEYIGQILAGDTSSDSVSLFAHEGQVYAYAQWGLVHIITPDGVFEPAENPTVTFSGSVLLASTAGGPTKDSLQLERNPLLVASDGIFQVDFASRQVFQVVDAETSAAALALPETKGDAASLWVVGGNRLSQYRVASSVADEPLESALEPIIAKTGRYPLPLLAAEEVGDWGIGTTDETLTTVTPINGSKIILKRFLKAYQGGYQFDVMSIDSGIVESGNVWLMPSNQARQALETYFIPPGVIGLFAAVTNFLRDDAFPDAPRSDPEPRMVVIALVLNAAVSAALAIWISRRRGVSPKKQLTWAALAGFFGAAALPAIVAIHAKVICEACPRCAQSRRIDAPVCDACGAEWDRLPRDGNEVLGGRTAESLTQAGSMS